MRKLKYWEAISEALVQCMAEDKNIFIAGAGVDDPRGIFGTTLEAYRRFGKDRVFDIPNCENAFAGIATGAAVAGKRPVVVHARDDFMFLASDQIINLMAKWKYMFGGKNSVPMLVRGITGRGWGQGATHSQSLHTMFAHFPGLYVIAPAFPSDVKGLIISALHGNTPVLLFENRACYQIEEEVSEELVPIPFGKARVVREGKDITIVGASLMAYEALRAADILKESGVSAEVIDPRSIRPLDRETILASIAKTGRLVIADTSWNLYGFTAEIAALAAEEGWQYLKAPVRRLAQADCPAPVSKPLEEAFHPTPLSIVKACQSLMELDVDLRKPLTDIQEHFQGPY
ncbi:MAG: alpha-ketoacid dehydrogenase subunit beta [Deltaproteobacteria bacterium]|nr:alpha-ketoacid dehydrogenase subunit beta [Deltaproteobacteria bacterium]